ncbi:sensor domain-containing diguanylate cyclase [bacterium 19GA11TI05]|uniref:Sensor domain-containing diguanylate cyclase n=3 Tax=Bacteria TaxID=2 RepID=A0AAU6TXK7_UNCXX
MLILSLGGIVITSALLLSALTLFMKGNIEDSLLESNLAYARKLADTTDRYLSIATKELTYSAEKINNIYDIENLKQEANRLRQQSSFFNSIVIVSSDSVIAATSPEELGLVGLKLVSQTNLKTIGAKKTIISEPFISVTGNYVVFISQPIIHKGQYLGYVGGTIYLKKESMLSDLLSTHFYNEGIRVFIISNRNEVIFSREPELINTEFKISKNLNKKILSTRYGRFYDRNGSHGELIGYASLENANWKVIIAGSSRDVSTPLWVIIINAVWFTSIIIIFITALVIYLSGKISLPLEQITEITRKNDSEVTINKLLKINAWYREAERLKIAITLYLKRMIKRVNQLNDETMIDTLTGLYNRKGFYFLVNKCSLNDEHSIIAIDIDNFKGINDKYGHASGDEVLIRLSKELILSLRNKEVICRFGGEEFIIFLADTNLKDAAIAAERIRLNIDETIFPHVNHVTISLGVSSIKDNDGDILKALHHADKALYDAKSSGRNKVVVSGNIDY